MTKATDNPGSRRVKILLVITGGLVVVLAFAYIITSAVLGYPAENVIFDTSRGSVVYQAPQSNDPSLIERSTYVANVTNITPKGDLADLIKATQLLN